MTQKQIAESLAAWKQSARSLFNLAEMIEFFAVHLLPVLDSLDIHHKWAEESIASHGDVEIGDGLKVSLREVLRKARHFLDSVNMEKSILRQVLFSQAIKRECTYRMLQAEITGLKTTIKMELWERKFAFVLPEKSRFFEQVDLLGKSVDLKFPYLRSDARDAGNCLAQPFHTGEGIDFARQFAWICRVETNETAVFS